MYLNCKTYFSFRYGTFSTKELVKSAVDKGVTALALTNINTTCDTWDFVKYCQEEGIKPIAGVEIRNGDKLLYILIAANNKGLAWIHEFLSPLNPNCEGILLYPFSGIHWNNITGFHVRA